MTSQAEAPVADGTTGGDVWDVAQDEDAGGAVVAEGPAPQVGVDEERDRLNAEP